MQDGPYRAVGGVCEGVAVRSTDLELSMVVAVFKPQVCSPALALIAVFACANYGEEFVVVSGVPLPYQEVSHVGEGNPVPR